MRAHHALLRCSTAALAVALAPLALAEAPAPAAPLDAGGDAAGQAEEPQAEEVAAEDEIAELDLTELVRLEVSPFDVSTRDDRGYRASSSISASRFDAPIRELPFALQAFTEAFVRDVKPVTLWDVARYSPGVTYRSNDFNEGNANLSIRGFAVGSLAGGNIHVLRDGLPGPSIFDFTNVARVEVVKGPASFLYGQVAPGGIVNVITKTPQPKLDATANLRYGSYYQYRLEGDVTGPAAKGLYYRLAGSYDQDLRYYKPYDGHSWDLAPALLWRPAPWISVSARYETFSKDEAPQLMQKPGYGAQVGVVPTAGDPNLSGVDVPGLPDDWNGMSFADHRASRTHALGARIDLVAGEHWDVRAGYSHLTYDTEMFLTGNLGMSSTHTVIQGRRVRHQTYANRNDVVEVDALGRYRFDALSLRLLLGGQLGARRFDTRAAQAPNDPSLGTDPIASALPRWDLSDPSTWDRTATIPLEAQTASPTAIDLSDLDVSAYAGSTLGFFDDHLLVLAGARVTATDRDLVDRVSATPSPRSTGTRATPQLGVLYRFTPGLSAFASYAESFVPGSYFIRHADGTTSPAEPTEGRGVDVGIKADLFEGRLSGTLTFFDLRNRKILTDVAITRADGTIVFEQLAAGEQRSYGVELDATLRLLDGWQLYLSYSAMDARITEVGADDAATLARDPATLDAAGRANYRNVLRFHDAPLQMSAPHLANLWTRYDVLEGALAGLFFAGGANLVVDQTILPDTPAWAHQTYVLLDAVAGWTWSLEGHPVTLDVTGKNLADATYRPSQSTRRRPREVLLQLTARF